MEPTSESQSDPGRALLRHAVATLAYRGGKALRDAPAGFGEFRVAPTTRTPGQILAHISDLLDWALSQAKGAEKWHSSDALPWKEGVSRFFTSLLTLDSYLASEAPLATSKEKLMQAPIADALTHIGQISMLRRLAGAAVRGENYAAAKIVIGRVGPEQTAPDFEFD